MRITEFLRDIAPNFMWCTLFDLYLMYEQINEDVEFNTFKQIFHQMFRKGYFVGKPDDRQRRVGRRQRKLYIRR
jgi:hypothetical protein